MQEHPVLRSFSPSLPGARGFAAVAVLSCLGAACRPLPPADARLAATTRTAPAREHAPIFARVDVEHYALDLSLDPAQRSLEGVCTLRFAPREDELLRLSLDCEELVVSHVFDAQGRALRFAHRGGLLDIDLLEPALRGQSNSVAIHYRGEPRRGLYFAAERQGVPTQVWTQGECEDSRWWFPCVDQPSERATSEIRVSMPRGWTSIAAGTRIEQSENAQGSFEHWRMDFAHPAYLTTLCAGEFSSLQGEWDGIPLSFHAAPEYVGLLGGTFAETDDVLAFFSDLTALRYPYSKYAQVAVDDFAFGGMENISASTLTDTALCDERALRDGGSVGLIAHEAAHQWYGNALTCADWSHIWLNEGFATYLTQLYFEASRGADDFRARMRDLQESYLAEDVGAARRPTVHAVYKEPMDLFFGGQAYAGGAARLHLLRFVLGEQRFFDGLRSYTAEHVGRGVTTDDLRHSFEKTSGVDLGWFFEQWFQRAGYPEFQVRSHWDESRGVLELSVRQTQEPVQGTPAVFRTPVEVEIASAGGRSTHRLQIEKRAMNFELECALRPEWVLFDKQGWIPKLLDQERGVEEWLALAAGSDDVNARRDACEALGLAARGLRSKDAKRFELCVAELVHRLRKDSSPHARASAAAALGVAGGDEALERLMSAAALDQDAEVREAALRALAAFGPNERLAGFGRDQFKAGWSWDVMAAAAGLVAKADPAEAYAWLSSKLFESSPHDQLRASLLAELAALDSPGVSAQLVRWAEDDSTDSNARAAAARGLGRHGANRPEVRAALVRLLEASDFRVRSAAIAALAEIGEAPAREALQAYYPRSVDARERRAIEAALRAGR